MDKKRYSHPEAGHSDTETSYTNAETDRYTNRDTYGQTDRNAEA